MSWQTYVDDHLMCDIEGNHLISAAILGHDGSVWAQSASFPKVKQLDENLPSELEDVLSKKQQTEKVGKLLGEDVALASDSFINAHTVSVGKHEATVVHREAAQVVKVDSSKVDESKGKHKHLNDQVGAQSMEMLKVRAAPEEKLRQKGIFGSIASKGDKVQKRRLVNGQLETLDDFDDDTTALE
ncbi:hypothetical protein LOK49_LG15G02582 [Camellia lanceoleosa]|uniref:Uncharacterized protein n=1 Tax=Camellia lanceoleosa TaxID=1840588 RepID=A0ACC0F7D4_9ERIC|nr:hypothetical protein LOK49_LG15G02582 [Camellia lanceoleosa]